ncbi:TPA: hypothetical protein R8G25_000420 [Citrobacter freundii]|nr:hypothetical protein [Citrobacter freundii]HEE9922583.1 hypothetical protein [Citrobacter freundii]
MGSNIIELAKLGHERAAELKASCGAVDVRSLAQLISDLATQLEVQFVRSTDMAVQLANAESKCRELAAENAALKAFGGKLGDMHNDLNGEGTGIQGRAEVAIQQVALEAAIEEFDAINTSATDAFLAEVRASCVESAINTVIAMMNHQHPVTSKAIDILRVHAAQLRKGDAL